MIRGSIVASISACHAEDPGSIPGRGVAYLHHALVLFECLRRAMKCTRVCKKMKFETIIATFQGGHNAATLVVAREYTSSFDYR